MNEVTNVSTQTRTEQVDAEIAALRGELGDLTQRQAALQREIAEKWGSDTQALELEAAQISVRISTGNGVLSKLENKRVEAVRGDARDALLHSQEERRAATRRVEAAAERIWKKWQAVISEVSAFESAGHGWNAAKGEHDRLKTEARQLGVPDLREIVANHDGDPSWKREIDEVIALARKLKFDS